MNCCFIFSLDEVLGWWYAKLGVLQKAVLYVVQKCSLSAPLVKRFVLELLA